MNEIFIKLIPMLIMSSALIITSFLPIKKERKIISLILGFMIFLTLAGIYWINVKWIMVFKKASGWLIGLKLFLAGIISNIVIFILLLLSLVFSFINPTVSFVLFIIIIILSIWINGKLANLMWGWK